MDGTMSDDLPSSDGESDSPGQHLAKKFKRASNKSGPLWQDILDGSVPYENLLVPDKQRAIRAVFTEAYGEVSCEPHLPRYSRATQ